MTTRFGFQPRNTPAERRAFFDLIRARARTTDDIELILDTLEVLEWEAVNRATGGSSTTASATYVDWPATPLTVSFTKVRADTALIVDVGASGFANASAGAADWGVRIASTDYDVIDAFFNNTGVHAGWNNSIRIPGLAAGAYTATLRAKTTAGSLNSDVNDTVSMAIRERF